MADPIKIIQTAITVTQQIHAAVECIKGAPAERKAIESEVARVHLVLEYLIQILGSRAPEENPEKNITVVQGLCNEARGLIDMANSVQGNGRSKSTKLRKTEWPKWLLQRSNREELVKQLRRLNSTINTYFSYDSHRELSQFREKIDGSLQVVAEQIAVQSSTIQDFRDDIQESRCDISVILQDISRRLDQQDSRGEELYYMLVRYIMRAAVNDQIHGINQHFDQVTAAHDPSFQPSRPMNVPLELPCADPTTQLDSSSAFTRIQGLDTRQGGAHTANCLPHCRCRCHRPPISAIPDWLRFVAGRLCIHHEWLSAIASARTACNIRECRRHRPNLLQIKYDCPAWFAQINAEIRTERIPVHVVIYAPRVVDTLSWLHTATLDEVRQKLWSRELTVNDVEADGESVLHRVTWRLTADGSEAALAIVALVMERSAPMDWQYDGLTPGENALCLDLCPQDQYFAQDIEDVWENLAIRLRWTELHRSICALSFSETSFTTRMVIPPELGSQLNTKDSFGMTPLFYAIRIGPAAVHALLAAGADPKADPNILACAARAGADAAIGMLVRAGALICPPGLNRTTAQHWAAIPILLHSINGPAVALELVRHAGHLLDWGVRDADGDTPLDWARMRVDGHPTDEGSKRILELYRTRTLPHAAQYLPTPLIVDAEDESAEGDTTGLPPTSLVRAGIRGDIGAIGDLIRRGAMVNERDRRGRTLLHLVAFGLSNGYRVALELVRHGGWAVDWDASVKASFVELEDDCRVSKGSKSEFQFTALEIAELRLKNDKLSTMAREELERIRDLLKARRLPLGESYLWPCIDPEFYNLKELPLPPMPGAWSE